MIGFITVTLTRGQLVNREQLHGLVAALFPDEAPKDSHHQTSAVQKYIEDLPSVYTCIPRNGSRASFLWQGGKAFEVVVEASFEASLIATVEGIVHLLPGRLKEAGVDPEFRIMLKGSTDFRIYIMGEPISQSAHLWRLLRPNVVAIVIAILIALIASQWLKQYFEESIASLIALSLFTLYTLYTALGEAKHRGIHWTVTDRVE